MDHYEMCRAAFEKALFVYPKEGARVVLKSKEN